MTPRPLDRPLIAITVADPRPRADPALAAHKNELYADAVRRAGGEPALIDESAAETDRERLFGAMDGLLLSGGADIDPALYGGRPSGAEAVERARDRLELGAWRSAERRRVPVLGICRGLQAMNVFSGGRLLQHVPDHAGRSFGSGAPLSHPLVVARDSRLGTILGGEPVAAAAGQLELAVNSYHHQAVGPDELAPSLVAVAWSDSSQGRLVEGLESRDGRWLVAVQCHPERTETTPAEFDRLWSAFVAEASAAGAGSRASATA